MATIENLALTLSKSTDGAVGVKVRYTASFSPTECSLPSLEFYDVVWIFERKGELGDYAGDPRDVAVAWLDTRPNFKPSDAKDGKIVRSIERNLTPDELVKLREVGREHPYAVVYLRPYDPYNITEDFKSVELPQIDVGDPGE
jgi:hypothetical protein